MEKDVKRLVGICGIYCGTCPQFLAPRLNDTEELENIQEATGVPVEQIRCNGCLSDHLFPSAAGCKHGFRRCAEEKKVTWCFQCPDFPCQRLHDFRDVHIVNGISHHEHLIAHLEDMRERGVEEWVAEQEAKERCSECGVSLYWCSRECPNCHKPVKR